MLDKKRRKRLRDQRYRSAAGASIILICALAALLVAALYVGYRYALILGGSNEVRNAVDAAALNVSKRVCQLKVPVEGVYGDCADTTGLIGLTNVNRVWGKAFLINANMQSMQNKGAAGPNAGGNAQQAYQQAQSINDTLGNLLHNKQVLDQYFNQLAGSRPARMLGGDSSISTNARAVWATAMVDRGLESNISFSPAQLPPGISVTAAGKYIAGYTPLMANNKAFCLTSFRPGEMPHLISDTYFDKNRGDTNPVPRATNPLPNAFRETGNVDNGQTALSAAASATANPMKQYQLSIPHAYVRLQFGNIAKWIVEGKTIKVTPYGSAPETQWGVKQYQLPPPNGGKLDGYASLGNEYKKGSVWASITALPGDHSVFMLPMLQRIQEIQPNYTLQQLIALLQGAHVDPKATNYYIFPVYKTTDLTDPSIQVQPETGSLPGWLHREDPDGIDMSLGTEPPVNDDPNYCWENIVGGKSPTGKHFVTIWGAIKWQPGTGFGGCLGVLKLARESDCNFSGEP